MHIFISHAHEDRRVAEKIHFALIGAGHTTFFDRDSLAAGREFHHRIQSEIERCDVFVFLVSPDSVARGGYSLSEMNQARARWPHPRDRVVPVLCREVAPEQLPEYLMQVTLVQPEGNLAADVLFAINRLAPPRDDGARARDESTRREAPPPGGAPTATLVGMTDVHNVMVPSPRGMALGMQVAVSADVFNAAGRMVQIVVGFSYFNGPPLVAHMQETWFRDPTGLLISYTMLRPVVGAMEAMRDQLVPMPYYVLNFPPMGGMGSASLAYTASVFVDRQPLATSMPKGFVYRY